MGTDEHKLLIDLAEKIDLKFKGVTKKQKDLAEKIENKIKETQETTSMFQSAAYSFPLSII
jgi:RNase adaptor protein for sRNA GlmZ degradation